MPFPLPSIAFITPTLPLSPHPFQNTFHSPRRPPRVRTPCTIRLSHQPNNLPSPLFPRPTTPPLLTRLQTLVKISALSAAVILTASLAPPRPRHTLAASVVTSSVKDTSGTGDAQAAAMTLGAVTIGALVMRAIVASRRDEEAERRQLLEECQRLEQEEKERALRAKRRKMEMVEGGVMGDDDLMTDFMKRVRSLEGGEEDDEEEEEEDDAAMRHTPIPDRGTGSAVLDRPEGGVVEEKSDPEQLEMLKRMWNLSTDGEGKGKGKGKQGGK